MDCPHPPTHTNLTINFEVNLVGSRVPTRVAPETAESAETQQGQARTVKAKMIPRNGLIRESLFIAWLMRLRHVCANRCPRLAIKLYVLYVPHQFVLSEARR